jgi:hypothetical protein
MDLPLRRGPFLHPVPDFLAPDRAYIWPLLQAYAKDSGSLHSEIKEIRAFGSILDPGARFDNVVRLLLILDHCDLPIQDRDAHYMGPGFRFGAELYPLTRAEIEQELDQGNAFLRRAIAQSRVIYRAA